MIKYRKYNSETGKELWGDLPLEYGKIIVPPSALIPESVIEWESEEIGIGIYEVDVFVGVSEMNYNNVESSIGAFQELFIYDKDIDDFAIIGASHALTYTGPNEGNYALLNRTLQGSRIITLDNDMNRFKIRLQLPNHAGGTGALTGGYIHYRKIV